MPWMAGDRAPKGADHGREVLKGLRFQVTSNNSYSHNGLGFRIQVIFDNVTIAV